MTAAPARSRSVTGGWLLVAFQCGFALWFVFCLYLALSHAAKFSGFLYIPSSSDAYTSSLSITTDWGWAFPVTWTLSTASLLSGLTVVGTAILLITRYAQGNRALTAMLVFGGLVAVLTAAAGVHPDVLSIAGWLND